MWWWLWCPIVVYIFGAAMMVRYLENKAEGLALIFPLWIAWPISAICIAGWKVCGMLLEKDD
jgi:hypothetical protein